MFKSHPRQLIFLRKSDCLGYAVLLCLVCLTLLASFFLPSASLVDMYIIQYNSPSPPCVCFGMYSTCIRQHGLHWVTSIPPAVYRPGVVVFSDLIVIVWCMGIKCSGIVCSKV